MVRGVRSILFAAGLLLIATASAYAQGNGSIFGKVSDSTGGVMPGVTVTVSGTALQQPLTKAEYAPSVPRQNASAAPMMLPSPELASIGADSGRPASFRGRSGSTGSELPHAKTIPPMPTPTADTRTATLRMTDLRENSN